MGFSVFANNHNWVISYKWVNIKECALMFHGAVLSEHCGLDEQGQFYLIFSQSHFTELKGMISIRIGVVHFTTQLRERKSTYT